MTTPTCPNCGAKFSYDASLDACRKCGLPDEVKYQGMRAVARWRRQPRGVALVGNVLVPEQRLDTLSKRQRKLARSLHGGSAGRKRNKHGRMGVR